MSRRGLASRVVWAQPVTLPVYADEARQTPCCSGRPRCDRCDGVGVRLAVRGSPMIQLRRRNLSRISQDSASYAYGAHLAVAVREVDAGVARRGMQQREDGHENLDRSLRAKDDDAAAAGA